MAQSGTAVPGSSAPQDVRSYSVIFVLSFLVFLVIALTGQLFGCHWRSWLPGAEGVKSIFGGVKAAVYTFMSYLQ
jgi:light-harvesting complex 1 beta chain